MAVLMAASVAASLAGCGGSSSSGSSDSSSDSASSDSGKVYKIGICQQLEHEALDQATQGFEDACEENSEKTMLHLTFRMDRVSRQTVQPLRIALLRIMWI